MVMKFSSKNNHKIMRVFVAVLLLSQWFSLVHAAEHVLQDEESVCHVCKLNSDHNQTFVVGGSQDFSTSPHVYELPNYETQHRFFSCYVKTIRAPPKTLL